MIHLAWPTVPPVVITLLTWNLFCFVSFWKEGTDRRTNSTCENSDHYRPGPRSATWINNKQQLHSTSRSDNTEKKYVIFIFIIIL